jgi:hypothetical protein
MIASPEQLASRVQLYVQPGERVRQVFLAQGGPSPYAWVVMWLLGPFVPLRIVVVTDRRILLLRASRLSPARPKALHPVVDRLPLETWRTPLVRGTWCRIVLASHGLWVQRQFYPQILAVDKDLDGPSSTETSRSPVDPRGGGTANVLLPMGLFTAILGIWDASRALGDQERFLGALFALAGLTMLAAGICLLSSSWRDEWGRPLGILAGVAGLAVGAYFAASQIGFPGARFLGFWVGDSRVFWFGVVLMAAAALALWRLPRPDESATTNPTSEGGAASENGGSKRAKTVTTVLASVGAFATLLLGVVQFWYTNQYLPAKGGAALTATANIKELQPGDQTGRFRMFAVTMRVKNIGATKTQVLSSLYTVAGGRVAKADYSDHNFFSRAAQDTEGDQLPTLDPRVSRYAAQANYDLLKFGEVVSEGWYFEPAEEFSTQIIVSVPNEVVSSYQFLNLSMDFRVAKGNRLNPDFYGAPVHQAQLIAAAKRDHTQYIVTERPIRPLSQLQRLTRGTHTYASILDMRSFDLPVLISCIDDSRRFEAANDPAKLWYLCGSNNDLARQLQEFYGSSLMFMDLEQGIPRQRSKEQLQPPSSEELRPFPG